jgi:hypothetical protein
LRHVTGQPTTEAEWRLELLALPASDEVLREAVEHAGRVYVPPDAADGYVAQFRAASSDLQRFGTMTADVRRAWRNLGRRIRDEGVSARVAELSDVVTLGACRGGEVSAASFAFVDGSYLILFDHGLATLTWLIAQLYAISRTTPLLGLSPPPDPLGPDAAARVLRLASSWLAAGGRAGVSPPLVMSTEEITAAGVLISEMDLFIVGHELAHILLGHFDGSRPRLGAVGGSGQLIGKRRDEEHAADLLALTLMFDDVLTEGTASSAVVELRLTAVRLFMAVLDVFERSCFLVQPASHPSASDRWRYLSDEALSCWFEDFEDAPAEVAQGFLDALDAIAEMPRAADVDVMEALGDRLDRPLWRPSDWAKAADLAHLLTATDRQALVVLRTWRGWPPGTDVTDEIQRRVMRLMDGPAVQAVMRAAVTGTQSVTRLEAIQVLTTGVEGAGDPDTQRYPSGPEQPFPAWAIAVLAMNTLRRAVDDG